LFAVKSRRIIPSSGDNAHENDGEYEAIGFSDYRCDDALSIWDPRASEYAGSG
jgi:hypothetical protein